MNEKKGPVFRGDAESREVIESGTDVQARSGHHKVDAKKLIIYSEIMRPKFDE